ncbi:hypothetical protein B0T26DRAFT_717953 [Lasiosphaeria miniovina]|uniref:Uncharacterized protein n=1 Tax=Lasiosphaeria miniovina TaxID=1954250 RepID=A0AA40AD26_9PEZI|nr:uncharacterized protein B0T26DRAFT_717953 [Lasiosphaeria miniovina]KAK0713621.1 hypothetical protein B0T26DRAFT_717953 [Lasiosphaeria miniovina]
MTHWSLLPATDVDAQTLFNNYYIDLVQGFTEKTLGNPEDVLNAFAGIVEHVTKTTKTTFLCGLCSPLTESLLWYHPTRAPSRREAGVPGQFPSWSWAGWKGPVRYDSFSHHPMYRRMLLRKPDSRRCYTIDAYQLIADSYQGPGRPGEGDLPDMDRDLEETTQVMLAMLASETRANVLYFCAVASSACSFTYRDEEIESKERDGATEERVVVISDTGNECGYLYGLSCRLLQGAGTKGPWLLVLLAAQRHKCAVCNPEADDGDNYSWCRRKVLLVRRDDNEYCTRWGVGWVHYTEWDAARLFNLLVRLV